MFQKTRVFEKYIVLKNAGFFQLEIIENSVV